MAKMKKGVLFTLGMTFLALSLLTLSILIYQTSVSSREINYNIISGSRMFNLFSAADYQFTKLFRNQSGISHITNSTNIIFVDELNSDFTTFVNGASNLKSTLNNIYGVNATVRFNSTELRLNVTSPYEAISNGISYYTYSGDMNKSIVIQDSANIYSYIIEINSSDANGTVNWNSISPGNTNFLVIFHGQNGWTSSSSQAISTGGFSLVTITGLSNQLNITINNGFSTLKTVVGNLTITTNLNVSFQDYDLILPIDIDYNMTGISLHKLHYPRIL